MGVTGKEHEFNVLPAESLKGAYMKQGLHPKTLSRAIEASVTVIEPVLPWTAAGAYMAGTLGVSTLSYLPWAVLNYTGIIFALICGFTGIGITKLINNEFNNELDEDI